MLKIEKKFMAVYDKWKLYDKEVCTNLRCKCLERKLCDMMDTVKKLESRLGSLYDDLPTQVTPSQQICMKIYV